MLALIRGYGTALATPLASSVPSVSTTCVRSHGVCPRPIVSRSCARSSSSAERSAAASEPL